MATSANPKHATMITSFGCASMGCANVIAEEQTLGAGLTHNVFSQKSQISCTLNI